MQQIFFLKKKDIRNNNLDEFGVGGWCSFAQVRLNCIHNPLLLRLAINYSPPHFLVLNFKLRKNSRCSEKLKCNFCLFLWSGWTELWSWTQAHSAVEPCLCRKLGHPPSLSQGDIRPWESWGIHPSSHRKHQTMGKLGHTHTHTQLRGTPDLGKLGYPPSQSQKNTRTPGHGKVGAPTQLVTGGHQTMWKLEHPPSQPQGDIRLSLLWKNVREWLPALL